MISKQKYETGLRTYQSIGGIIGCPFYIVVNKEMVPTGTLNLFYSTSFSINCTKMIQG